MISLSLSSFPVSSFLSSIPIFFSSFFTTLDFLLFLVRFISASSFLHTTSLLSSKLPAPAGHFRFFFLFFLGGGSCFGFSSPTFNTSSISLFFRSGLHGSLKLTNVPGTTSWLTLSNKKHPMFTSGSLFDFEPLILAINSTNFVKPGGMLLHTVCSSPKLGLAKPSR